MKCDLCNKPAVVHEVTVQNGVKHEVHLCAEHAAESGIALPSHQPINELLTQSTISKQTSRAEKKRSSPRRTCPECGMGFDQFRRHGLLGCPTCYETFEKHLAPLIERTQNGATHHTGKHPARADTSIDRQLERRRLVKELDEAVSAEQYERAAQIRDALRAMDSGSDDSTSLPTRTDSPGR